MKNKKLEEIILKFTNKANQLIDSNFKLGSRFLRQAIKTYHKMNYKENIEHEVNQVCLKYMDLYLK